MVCSVRSRSALMVAALVVLLGADRSAHAEIVYESATLGTTGQPGGFSINDEFLGSRFTLTQSTEITHIGGHIGDAFVPGTIWGAIIALGPGPTALPTFGSDPVSNHALASAVFTPPAVSTEVTVALTSPVVLGPGQYGLLFGGAGDFGTTGDGRMPRSTETGASNLPGASYFLRGGNGGWFNVSIFDRTRFTVLGETSVIPLPTTAWLWVIMLGGLGATQMFRRKRLAA